VTLSGSAPAGGITVTLSSDQAQAVVPSSVTIPAGSASTTFAVTTTGGLSQTIAHITATYGSASQSASLTIGTLSLVSVSVSPIYITSGQPATGTVSISGPAPSGGVTVNLSSSTPGIVNVGGSVSIPANATSATFAVTTGVTGAQVTSTVTGTIGASSASSTVTVTPAAGVSFGKGISLISVPYDYPGVSPSSVIGPVNTDVILAVWNPLTSAYALTPTAPAGDVRLGRGYWAGLQSAGTLLYFGTPAPTNQNFGISVDKGWNQIGDPFLSGVPLGSLTVTSGSQTVSFAQAVSNGWIYGTVYGYTGGSSNSYYSAGLLATGSGYWLYAFQPVTVTVPHP